MCLDPIRPYFSCLLAGPLNLLPHQTSSSLFFKAHELLPLLFLCYFLLCVVTPIATCLKKNTTPTIGQHPTDMKYRQVSNIFVIFTGNSLRIKNIFG